MVPREQRAGSVHGVRERVALRHPLCRAQMRMARWQGTC
jgi:hypothetical protein